MSSHRRGKVFEQEGQGNGSVCLDEGPAGFLPRFEGPGLRVSELLEVSAATTPSSSPESSFEKEYGDTGNAGLPDEVIVSAPMAEALELRWVLASNGVEFKGTVSNGVKQKSKSWTVRKSLSSGKSGSADVEAMERSSGNENSG